MVGETIGSPFPRYEQSRERLGAILGAQRMFGFRFAERSAKRTLLYTFVLLNFIELLSCIPLDRWKSKRAITRGYRNYGSSITRIYAVIRIETGRTTSITTGIDSRSRSNARFENTRHIV